MNSKYKTISKQVKNITDKERMEIVSLYLRYYDGSSPAQVIYDLENKTEIILMLLDDKIVGFTTLEFYQRIWNEKTIGIVYSGDTIIEREHWGQQSLTFACITRMGQYKQENPEMPLYWFLIVKGHRTYKYLPVFMTQFYPHWKYQSESLRNLAEFLAYDKFGDIYNAGTGVLEFPESKGYLKEEYAYPGENERNKIAVSYFLTRNPHYIKGHELVCLCELTGKNMKPLTRRVFEKGSI